MENNLLFFKIPEIDTLEKRWKELMKQKADKFISRRQTDVKYQSLECSIGKIS